jgi:diadenosine tetraphosphate (Ap4A) HIT family hydrolase
MIIREVTKEDIPAWLELAHDKDAIIDDLVDNPAIFWVGFVGWAERKIERHEAFIAADRITNKCLGIIAFSRKHNRVTFIAGDRQTDFEEIGGKLLGIVLNQLDWDKEITANVLNSTLPIIKQEQALYTKYGFKKHHGTILEAGVSAHQMIKPATAKKNASTFHFNYPQYIEWMQEEKCPICNYETNWENYDLVVKLEYSTVYASMKARGGLWGNCMIVSKKHVIEFSDFTPEELTGFIFELKDTTLSLKEITRAVRINMEQHGNTIPHLHIQLFPRYIDDLNAGQPIDDNKSEASTYESRMDYDYFIQQLRKKLSFIAHRQIIEVKHKNDIQLDTPSAKTDEV